MQFCSDEITLLRGLFSSSGFTDFGYHYFSESDYQNFSSRYRHNGSGPELPPKGSFIIMTTLHLPEFRSEQDNGSDKVPYGEIAPFASADYYKEAVRRLKRIRRDFSSETGTDASGTRLFCNSSLPEKPLAYLCGLGSFGKNTLLINRYSGTRHILCGMLFTGALSGLPNPEPAPPDICGNCSACIANCPSNALDDTGFTRERCIQHLSSTYVLPESDILDVWGTRIYGCTDCQTCCPWNKNKKREKQDAKSAASPEIKPSGMKGFIGERFALQPLLEYWLSGNDIREYFRNSVLHARWMDQRAFVRNAIIAAAGKNYTRLVPLIRKISEGNDPILREISRWALSKIS